MSDKATSDRSEAINRLKSEVARLESALAGSKRAEQSASEKYSALQSAHSSLQESAREAGRKRDDAVGARGLVSDLLDVQRLAGDLAGKISRVGLPLKKDALDLEPAKLIGEAKSALGRIVKAL
jgi:DNA repair exonuclease SbcCD ATPase subunit